MSPVFSHIDAKIPNALSSPHTWISLALIPRKAFVQECPQLSSSIIWISSITAQSYWFYRSHISIVELQWVSPGVTYLSYPVIREHLTLFEFNTSETSQANNLKGDA